MIYRQPEIDRYRKRKLHKVTAIALSSSQNADFVCLATTPDGPRTKRRIIIMDPVSKRCTSLHASAWIDIRVGHFQSWMRIPEVQTNP